MTRKSDNGNPAATGRALASLKNLRERMDAYSVELMRYGVDEAEHDIRWLDEMLEAERRNGNTGAPTPEGAR